MCGSDRLARWNIATTLGMVALFANAGCATTTTNLTGEQITNVQQYSEPVSGREVITLQQDGNRLEVHVIRENVNRPMRRVIGYENLVIYREIPTWVTAIAIGGGVAATIGLLLATPMESSTGASSASSILGSQPVLGWSLVGAGTVAILPWLFSSSGTTTATRPFMRAEVDPNGLPNRTAGMPARNVRVELRHNNVTIAARLTDFDGDATFELIEVFPEQALYGTSPWREILVRTAGGASASLSLLDLNQRLADRAWNEFRGAPSADAATSFQRRFPRDPRREMVAGVLASAAEVSDTILTAPPPPNPAPAPASTASDNGRDWVGLVSETDPLERFAAREPADVYVVEARCRLASLQRNATVRQAALDACRRGLETLPPQRSPFEEAVFGRAVQERDAAIVAVAAEAAQTPRVDNEPSGRRGAHRDTGSSLDARLRRAIDRCRDGSASIDNARRAYTILSAMRGQIEAERFNTLRLQINVSCRSSSGAAGVSLP